MTNGKCYSTPKPAAKVSDATSRRIDEAFERAYRHVYHGEPLRPTADRQAIEDAYQANMARKRDAWKEKDVSGMFHHPDEAQKRAKAAAEFKMPHELTPYEANMQRKANAWKEGK